MNITSDNVKRGFEHIELIGALHFQKSPDEQMEAMSLVMESYGMDETARAVLMESLMTFVPMKLWRARGWVMMGFLAGLATADNAESD